MSVDVSEDTLTRKEMRALYQELKKKDIDTLTAKDIMRLVNYSYMFKGAAYSTTIDAYNLILNYKQWQELKEIRQLLKS